MTSPASRTTRLVLATATLTALISGCATTATPAPPAVVVATATSTPTPTVTTPAAPVADQYSQIVGGVLYKGTAAAPVKIGTDTPGQPPAAEASFPAHGGFAAIKAAAIALNSAKYTVVIAKAYAPDDTAATKPIGYRWMTFRINEYGNWKALDVSGAYPTQAAAAAAPHTLDGRVLDRSEYVIAYY